MVLARSMESQIWWPPAFACREGGPLNKAIMASVSTSVWEKAAPTPALTLKANNSFLSRISLVPFELLPQYWNSK